MKEKKIARLSRTPLALAIGCVFASTSYSAFAQDNNAPAAEEEKAERIVILGSRIRTDGMDQAAPVEVIKADIAIGQGITNLGELLRNSTVAAGSNQVTSAASTAFVTEGGTGTESIQLRGLGANRTLLLLNGRRAGPAGTRGQVSSFDLNVIPLSAIDRVEILKDGASSLYGSDAVAGVINIITKKGDDSSLNLNLSQPTEDGGESLSFDVTFGRSFDKGSFRLVADYKLQKELAKGQRDFFRCGERYVFDPNTGERADNIDPRTGQYHCSDLPWGHVWIYDYQDEGGNVPAGAKAQYDYDGNLGQFIPGFAVDPNNPDFMTTPPGWFPVAYDNASDAVYNSDHPFQDLESLVPKTEVVSAYAQGDYSLTDDIMLYGEALLNRRTTTVNGYRQFWTYIANEDFFGGNPLSQGWTGAQWLSPTPITDHSGSEITVDYRRFVVGLSGEVGEWFWDMTYQNSHSDGKYKNKVVFDDAISPYTLFEGFSGSCVGETTPVRGVPCVDVPWLDPQFLAGNITGDVRDFLFGEEEGDTVYKQQTFEASITGDLYELPAGFVGAAFGASFQKDSIVDTPGDVTLAGNAWGASTAGITAGESETTALYGEVNIPLLRDVAFAESLDLIMSGRFTDVSSYGSDTTYKIGANWLIGEGVRLRASRGTSFRSPALFELYLNNQTSFASQRSIDPCINWGIGLNDGSTSQRVADNCASDGIPADFNGGAISATVTSGGGAGVLKAETSVSKTVGLVWLPEFENFNFSMSVDYFNIEIDGEVTLLTASQIVGNCYLSENFASEPLCSQFDRDPVDQRISDVRGGYLNIANQVNRGIDFQFAYSTSTPIGELNMRYEHTLQLEASRQLFPTSEPEDKTGEFGSPENVGNLTVELVHDDWRFNWLARYVGSVENHTSYGDGEYRDTRTIRGEEVRIVLSSDAVIYHTFSATKEFGDTGLVATLGVANAFDKAPPRVTTVNVGELDTQGNSAFYSQYDWFGRRVFMNVTYSF
jgi:iron complex outermembrane recepter protein